MRKEHCPESSFGKQYLQYRPVCAAENRHNPYFPLHKKRIKRNFRVFRNRLYGYYMHLTDCRYPLNE